MSERQDVADHIFGSGCLTYEWWSDVGETVEGWMVYAWDENFEADESKVTNKEITIPDLRNAANALVEEGVGDRYTRLGLIDFYLGDYENCDIDANAADLILQKAFYGEVVWG